MHRFNALNLSGEAAPPPDAAAAAAIARWTSEALGLGPDAVVRVFESPCLDPGCPIVETVIAVFEDGGTRSWRFARPRAAVTKAMVIFALQGPAGTTKGG